MAHSKLQLICSLHILLAMGSRANLVALGNKAYFIEDKIQYNWFGALNFCTSQGMNLLTVESAQERQLLADYINARGLVRNYWTSGHDNAESRKFVWSATGKPFGYTNWLPGEPNNVNERCVMTWADKEMHWNDSFCTEYFFVICETKKTCA